jgi:anti-sigma B factor antagonist
MICPQGQVDRGCALADQFHRRRALANRRVAVFPQVAMTGVRPITTSLQHHDGVAVLAVAGEIDMLTAPQFEEAIDDVLADDPQALIIDLTEVTLLASAGLRLLATANQRFVLATGRRRSDESGGFAVVAGAPATISPIELTDLNEAFDLYPSLGHALAAMRSKHRAH